MIGMMIQPMIFPFPYYKKPFNWLPPPYPKPYYDKDCFKTWKRESKRESKQNKKAKYKQLFFKKIRNTITKKTI